MGWGRAQGVSGIYVGGNPKESEKWFGAVEDLLQGHLNAGSQENFVYEIVLDQETYKTQQSQFDSLLSRHGGAFKVTFWEGIPDLDIPIQVLEHANKGNPAFFSDAVRLWYLLNPDYETNVYLDVDTFIDKAENLSRYPEFKVFGAEIEADGLFNNTGSGEGSSNDYLVAKGQVEEKIGAIQSEGLSNFEKNNYLFEYYQNRLQFLNSEYGAYAEKLEEVIDYFIENNLYRFDLHIAIMDTFGPYLWERTKHSKTNPVVKDHNPSAGEWKGKDTIMGGLTSVNLMNSLQYLGILRLRKKMKEREIFRRNLLRLHFLALDYSYFSKFPNSQFAEQIKENMQLVWEELDLQSLAKNHIVKILSSTTGGLYLAAKILDRDGLWAQVQAAKVQGGW